MKYRKLSRPTQRDPLNTRQVKNNAGGYVYQLSDEERLLRFLILGSDKPTYYASERKLTIDNAQVIQDLWKKNPEATANTIIDVAKQNRAPKVDPTLFAVALGACLPESSSYALKLLPVVCRTASHLFSFLSAIDGHRGWGRSLTRAVASWYETRSANDLAYQGIKYRKRSGFSHKRAIELGHPRVKGDETKGSLLRALRGKNVDASKLPALYQVFLKAPHASERELIELIEDYHLPWEAVPTEALRSKKVWEALIEHMPMRARLRQLGTLTARGVLKRSHLAPFTDQKALIAARIHPFSILLALTTYAAGKGKRSSWRPLGFVQEVLNEAFYLSFQAVKPSNKRIMVGLDVSSSMNMNHIQGGNISAAEAAASMALVTIATEPDVITMAFSDRLIPITLHKRMALEDVVNRMRRISFGSTDCAQPMLYAINDKLQIDGFVIYTDNETWFGDTHPMTALDQYRNASGNAAKLIVVGMTSTGFSIADPEDKGSLDIVGFDSAAPSLISSFIENGI